MGEQDEVAEVHDQSEVDHEIGDVTFSAVGFDVDGVEVDETADHHLSQLTSGDGDRDAPVGETDGGGQRCDRTTRTGGERERGRGTGHSQQCLLLTLRPNDRRSAYERCKQIID